MVQVRVNIVLGRVATVVVVVDVEGNAPYHPMLLFEAVGAAPSTCGMGSTCLGNRDSCWNMNLDCTSTL